MLQFILNTRATTVWEELDRKEIWKLLQNIYVYLEKYKSWEEYNLDFDENDRPKSF